MSDGWTDPEAVGKGLGSLGPTAAVLICFVVLAAVMLLGLAALLVWWRGIERWGFVGFGAEYQKTRVAHERIAAATERTEGAQGEIKVILAALPGQIATAVLAALGQAPPTQREPRASQPRSSAPSLGETASCKPQP